MDKRYKLTAFFLEDVDALNPDIKIGSCLEAINEEMARSLWYDNRLIAAGGVVPIWPGVGIAWAMIARDIPQQCIKYTFSLYREWLKRLMERYNLHRVQADVKTDDFEKGHRFVKHLGFKHEGKMIAYGPDREDHERYAFVR